MSEAADTVERHEFGAEVGRLLDLVVHSLYSDREIFLRELVANAADATDRRRFEALTNSALALPDTPSVRIVPDKAARQLLIADHGIGMTKQEMAQNLGTIARSGTRAFGQALADAKPDERPSLIGQFGVGFYSAFMVADRVEVTSRHAGDSEAWTWASNGRRRLYAGSGRAGGGRHRHCAAHEIGRRGIPGADAAGDGGAQMGGPHHHPDHHRARRQGYRRQRRQRAVAAGRRRK